MAHADGCTANNKHHGFYGPMFEDNKKPTSQLDALLRGIAHYIIDEVGDKQVKTLTPAKLASFYKAVGGNYDALFVDIPHGSLSYIYASTGCEHTLQPTGDDYAPPSIPALTIRGFSRWQSIEILLGPEEHVPFMQKAVKNFGIRNPDNKELFPPILPTEVFPLHPDPDVERWHSSCAEKLRQEATPNEEPGPAFPPPRPKVRVQTGYTHVPAPRSTRNPHHVRDYFTPSTQFSPIRRARPTVNRNSSYHGLHNPESPSESRSRRRSFPENSSTPNLSTPLPDAPESLKPPADERNRRHSHPRHQKAPSTSSASSGDEKKRVPPISIPVMGVGGGHKPQRRYQYHPQDPPTPIRLNKPQNLHPELDSPNRSNSHSSSNSHGGAGSRHSRNNSDNDSLRERRRGHHHPHLSMDTTGQLSTPFMQGLSSRPVSSRSNSGVRRPVRNDLNIDDHPSSRRASIINAEDEDDDNTETLAYHRKRRDRSARSQDRGKTDRIRREKMRERELRERERDREHEREKSERDRLERGRLKERDGVGGFLSRSASIGAAKLGLKFKGSGSHEKEDRDERERGRDRDRSRERREYRDRDRRGEYLSSNLGSPGRGGDARRYPTDGVIRR